MPTTLRILAQSLQMALVFGGSALCACALGCSGFSSQGMNSHGVQLFEQARYIEAAEQFRQAIEADPGEADGYYNLASTYHRVWTLQRKPADLAQAERHYYLCLDRSPNHRECYRGLAVLLVEQDRSEEAFRLLQSWADRDPALADPKLELARLSEEFADREGAKQYLADALLLDTNNSQALAALGRLREAEGDRAQALANYQQALQANRFHEGLAARVAALQSSSSPAPLYGGVSSGTRTVTRDPRAIR